MNKNVIKYIEIKKITTAHKKNNIAWNDKNIAEIYSQFY